MRRNNKSGAAEFADVFKNSSFLYYFVISKSRGIKMLRPDLRLFCSLIFACLLFSGVSAQKQEADFEVITGRENLEKIVPSSFYFAGLSGNTQRRNSAVAKIGENHFIVAGLVDVSGYSTEISGVYEGFFITDLPVRFGDETLCIGAYGIGFAKAGTVNIFDLSGKQILSTKTVKDNVMRRPRPLMMVKEEKGIRLYKGRDYVLVAPK